MALLSHGSCAYNIMIHHAQCFVNIPLDKAPFRGSIPGMTDSHQQSDSRGSGGSLLGNIFAIIGSIILIVIIIWGLIHLFSISGGFLSSLFGGSNKIEITAPSEITSGEVATISWKHKAKETGMYALIYPCTEGLRFSTTAPDNAYVTIPCGAGFGIGSATTTAAILPTLTASTSIQTPLSVLFIPSSTSSTPIEATVTLTVNPAQVAEPAPAAPVKPTTPSQPSTPSGTGDLSVTITSVFVDQYGNGTATFNISNIGTGHSGAYTFTAQLPTAQPYTYVSPLQTSLAPGSYIVNTLRFSQAVNGAVSVIVDPSNTVTEANESNNTAVQYVTGAYPQNYQPQYNYVPTYYDIYNYPFMY